MGMVEDALKKKGITFLSKAEADPRIVYGVGCVWWDNIAKVSQTKNGLPCCPFCSSVLMEVESIEKWYQDVDKYEKETEPGYRAFIDWLRGKCYKTVEVARQAYKAQLPLSPK